MTPLVTSYPHPQEPRPQQLVSIDRALQTSRHNFLPTQTASLRHLFPFGRKEEEEEAGGRSGNVKRTTPSPAPSQPPRSHLSASPPLATERSGNTRRSIDISSRGPSQGHPSRTLGTPPPFFASDQIHLLKPNKVTAIMARGHWLTHLFELIILQLSEVVGQELSRYHPAGSQSAARAAWKHCRRRACVSECWKERECVSTCCCPPTLGCCFRAEHDVQGRRRRQKKRQRRRKRNLRYTRVLSFDCSSTLTQTRHTLTHKHTHTGWHRNTLTHTLWFFPPSLRLSLALSRVSSFLSSTQPVSKAAC